MSTMDQYGRVVPAAAGAPGEAKTTTWDSLLGRVVNGHATTLSVASEGDGKTIRVEARKLLPEPPREPINAPSLARQHLFHTAESLRDYLLTYGGKGTVIYADQPAGKIYATVDEAAGKGRETLQCVPQVHPLWAPWAAVSGESISIEAFADLVGRHRRVIVKPTGRDLVFLLSQIRVSVSIEVQKGRGRESINGLTVTTSVEPGRTQSVDMPFPEAITVRCPLFVGQPAFDIELDLTVSANKDGKAFVHVSAGTVDEARERAFDAMLEVLRAPVAAKGWVVTRGAPSQCDWKTLPEIKA